MLRAFLLTLALPLSLVAVGHAAILILKIKGVRECIGLYRDALAAIRETRELFHRPSDQQEGQLTQPSAATSTTRLPESPLDLAASRTYDQSYLTTKQAGAIVGLHPKTIEREIQRGHLRAFKPAGQIRIRPTDLEAWVEATALDSTPHEI